MGVILRNPSTASKYRIVCPSYDAPTRVGPATKHIGHKLIGATLNTTFKAEKASGIRPDGLRSHPYARILVINYYLTN